MMKKFSRKSSSTTTPPTAILTADWHIRSSVPVCRTDDFMAAMWGKVDFILGLSDQYGIPILIAGDVGLKSQWPNWLLEEFIGRVKAKKDPSAKLYAIPGQHDLPDHNLDLWRASAIGVLHEAEAITFLGVDGQQYVDLNKDGLKSVFPFSYGVEIRRIKNLEEEEHYHPLPLIAVVHTLVTERAPESFLAGQAQSAMSLLEKFPEYSLILCGDNHKGFVVEKDDRLLVNPGSLMRTTADQSDYKPRIYLWYAQENRVEPIYLPVEEGVISRDHIDNQEAKDERIEAYVLRLKEEVEVGLDFQSNLKTYFSMNRTRKPVQDKVWQAMPK